MRFSNPVRLRQQAQFLRRQFLQDGDLPFTDDDCVGCFVLGFINPFSRHT